MATLTPNGLQGLLDNVGFDGSIPLFPLADIQNSPMDIYLSHLADTLVTLTGCDPQHAYDAIQWPNDMGDLVVVIPRLRLKSIQPSELALNLQGAVGSP